MNKTSDSVKENSETNIILFDGVCNLCNKTVQFILKNDHNAKFVFASLQSESGQLLTQQLGLPPERPDSLIYIKDDKFYMRSTAVLLIFQKLGSNWRYLYGLILIPRVVRDMVYDFIAKRRYRCFGKREFCIAPAAEYKERFLE